MKICVFCSSSNNIDAAFKEKARELGREIAEKGHTLVYGGATGGLMDEVARGAAEKRGEIIGVIPEIIIRSKRLSLLPTHTIVTPGMSERKKQMREIADAFVVLPGGYGTLDEMFDVIASGTVGEHKKPLVCINLNGFFDDLLRQIDKMKTEAFTPKNENYVPVFVETVSACMDVLAR